jgi:uncharacterized membrane protein
VIPKTGLAAGTYKATVTVSGSNSISASFAVEFTVNPGIYKISLDSAGTHVFPAQIAGYTAANMSPNVVKVTNLGNQATGSLVVALSGSNPRTFSHSATSLSTIASGNEKSFTVTPRTSLVAGTYKATVTVSGGNGLKESFDVSFTVSPRSYGIMLDTMGTHSFAAQTAGYGSSDLSSKTVLVRSTGNQPTGTITLTLSGTNASSFTLSTASIASFPAGESRSFTIIPNTGLPAGTYTGTVTLTGTYINAKLNVSFKVI